MEKAKVQTGERQGKEGNEKEKPRTVEEFVNAGPRDRVWVLAQLVSRATVAELPVLLENILRREGQSGEAALRLVFTRWVDLDAQEMMVALEAKPLGWRYYLLQLAVKCHLERKGPEVLEAVRKKWPEAARAAAIEAVNAVPENVELLMPYLTGELAIHGSGTV
jgi:hypothetical protein